MTVYFPPGCGDLVGCLVARLESSRQAVPLGASASLFFASATAEGDPPLSIIGHIGVGATNALHLWTILPSLVPCPHHQGRHGRDGGLSSFQRALSGDLPAVHAGFDACDDGGKTPDCRCGHARCLKSSRGPFANLVSGGLIGEVPLRDSDVLPVPVRPQELGSDLTLCISCSLCAI